MHFYQKNIPDFNNATRHLTRVERSLFSDAIELYYDTEKPLIADIKKLERLLIANSEEEKEALGNILNEFFVLTDEGFFNKRCNEEILKYQSLVGNKSKAGKASAEQRAKQKATGVEQVLNTPSTTNTQYPIPNNPLPITKNQLPTTKKPLVLANIAGTNSFSPPFGNEVAKNDPDENEKNENREKIKTELQKACHETWNAYTSAFFERYGTDPVRNATVNSLVKSFVQRLGFTESPQVASWFVSHTDAFYVRGGHGFNLLTKDAEKLRTEWATGRRITQTKARQIEKTGTLGDSVNEILQKRATA